MMIYTGPQGPFKDEYTASRDADCDAAIAANRSTPRNHMHVFERLKKRLAQNVPRENEEELAVFAD
eukprot:12933237-Prorocentrum_lima.AAC.1